MFSKAFFLCGFLSNSLWLLFFLEKNVRKKGEKGIHIVNSMKRYVNKILPENVKVQTAYAGK